MAPPNAILIGGKTYRQLVGERDPKTLPFEIRDLGLHPLKGKEQEVRVYQVLRK
jgi:class 3 adenylate cyclase